MSDPDPNSLAPYRSAAMPSPIDCRAALIGETPQTPS